MQKGKKAQEYKNTSNLCTYALMTCALILAGCAQQQQQELIEQICVPDIGKAETMEAAEDILATMHFTIQKADVQSGLIRTRPLPGAQFFEFWRSDNVGADNCLQANLHTIRRTVELDISQRGEELCIGCEVQVQRLSLPERDISSSARAYGLYTRSSPSLQRLILNPEQEKGMAWVDLDTDKRLATEILRRIKEHILSQSRHSVPQTGNKSRMTGNET